MQNYCQNGSIASVSTAVGQVTFPRAVGGKFRFPSMYNKTDVSQLMGTISGILFKALAGDVEPWAFQPTYPFQVQILDFVYYNSTGPLTPVNADGNASGLPYFPPGGDYEAATSIRVSYQLVVQNVESQTQASTYLNTAMKSGFMSYGISSVYSTTPNFGLPLNIKQEAIFNPAQPLELPPKNSGNKNMQTALSVVMFVIACSAFAMSMM